MSVIEKISSGMINNLTSVDWWAGEIPSYIIFGVVVGLFVSWYTGRRQKKQEEPFRNWKLVIIYKEQETFQDMFWKEVEQFEASDIERWRVVKSVASDVGNVKLTNIKKQGRDVEWVHFDKQKRHFIVILDKAFKAGDVISRDAHKQL